MKNKRTKLGLLVGSLSLFLAACGTSQITENSTGLWDRGIVYNFAQIIIWLSEKFGGNYGVGIIIFTIIVRTLLLPLMHFQYKATRKTATIQPKVNELREKYSSKDRETQAKLQEEIQALYEREGINQWVSMIPLFVQMPILMALYQAILRTNVLQSGNFLWMHLGTPDPYFILPILAAIFTWATSYLSMKMMDTGGMGKVMSFILPAFILFISIPLPSALSLYWVVSNIYTVIQTLVMNNPYTFLKEQAAKQKLERDRKKALEKARKNPRKYLK